ncbi:single-stranded DNA-binding protein [Salmonella enterica]|nr:single-stranded DNA-binding protein [Salmonella enterica]EJO1639676.1 single-stranded DNA-binding protein [Salmonella enterica]
MTNSAYMSAHGRLTSDPQIKTSSSGAKLATARLVVSLPCHTSDDGAAPLWLGVVCFGKVAEQLQRCKRGDLISVSGAMQISQWQGNDGEAKEQTQVIADSLHSARIVKPYNGRN